KRHIQEMSFIIGDSDIATTCFCFSSSYQAFDIPHKRWVYIAWFLVFYRFDYFLIYLFSFCITAIIGIAKITKKVRKTNHIFIKYSNVSRGLVGHMHIMTLIYKSYKCATHRNYVIIRVWA